MLIGVYSSVEVTNASTEKYKSCWRVGSEVKKAKSSKKIFF